ncbi:MAG TPA: helix-turn-helix domain-containing protein [Nitriliruptorales bacterium]|nr:helix-turn-helix domain-containing protein [Nitriliruptorales bacterium]
MPSDQAQQEFLDAQHVADWLGVPIHTVTREARLGRLPARKVGKEWRFSRSALLAFFHGTTGETSPTSFPGTWHHGHRDLTPGPSQ